MNYYYDLHMHSCLSPCGDEDMTPYNLVQMSKLKGLDVIALTDHNTVGNCPAALQAGREADILVIPGMELCTAEEIHVICLFPGLDEAGDFGKMVEKHLQPIENEPEVFGRQLLMDAEDRILGEYKTLLITASAISIEDVRALCGEFGGICYPAHADRSSFSIVSALGVIPPELGFRAAELTFRAGEQFLEQHPILRTMEIIRSSDAHRLEDIAEPEQTLNLPELSAESVIRYFRNLEHSKRT